MSQEKMTRNKMTGGWVMPWLMLTVCGAGVLAAGVYALFHTI